MATLITSVVSFVTNAAFVDYWTFPIVVGAAVLVMRRIARVLF